MESSRIRNEDIKDVPLGYLTAETDPGDEALVSKVILLVAYLETLPQGNKVYPAGTSKRLQNAACMVSLRQCSARTAPSCPPRSRSQ